MYNKVKEYLEIVDRHPKNIYMDAIDVLFTIDELNALISLIDFSFDMTCPPFDGEPEQDYINSAYTKIKESCKLLNLRHGI